MLNASSNVAVRLANAVSAADDTIAALLPFVDVATLPPASASAWAKGLPLLDEDGAFSRVGCHALLAVLVDNPGALQSAIEALRAELLRSEQLAALQN